MLDVKLLRSDYDRVAQALKNRGASLDLISGFPEKDAARREKLTESDQLKNRRNVVSQAVAKLKKSGGDADALIAEMRETGDRI